MRYEVKTILAETYGKDALRPWRILPSDEYVHEVVGFVRDEDVLMDQSIARRNGFHVDLHTFDVVAGQEVELDVHASPTMKITVRDRETREITRRIYVDVPSAFVGKRDTIYPTEAEPNAADKRAAFGEWFTRKLSEERTGMHVEGQPILLDSGTVQAIRKIAVGPGQYSALNSSSPSSRMPPDGRRRVHKILPFAQVRTTVVVDDIDLFRSFVGHGLQGKKDIGMGSMIPVRVLEALGVAA